MEHKKTPHYCLLKVTPYVKQYLVNNFKSGSSKEYDCIVNLSADPMLSRLVSAMIRCPSHHYEKRKRGGYHFTNRSCVVAILVNNVYVSRSGFLLSNTDASDLALYLERRCHALMISYINMRLIFSPTLKECILDFQKKFNFTEDTWCYETIRRIWNRDDSFDRYVFRNFVQREINKIYLVQMKRTGYINKQFNLLYDETNS